MKYEKPELTLTPAIRAIQQYDFSKRIPDVEEVSGNRAMVISCYEENE